MPRLQSGLTLSQESEKAACEVVQSLRAGHRVIWHKPSDGPDMLFRDGTTGDLEGIGEVKVAVSPQRQRFWGAVDKRTVAGAIALPEDFGTWSCNVLPNVRIDRLVPMLPDLIGELRAQNQGAATGIWNQRLNDLGVSQLFFAGPGQDRCFLHLEMGEAAAISLDDLGAWLDESLFGNSSYVNSWNRLQTSDCGERHVFVWVMEGAPKALHMSLMLHSDEPPTSRVALPYRITHLWLATPSVFSEKNHVWLYTGHGWSAHEFA